MKRAAVEDTERNVVGDDEATHMEAIARRVATSVFTRAAVLALPALRIAAAPGTHGFIEGQHYDFRCFESTRISGQLLQVTDTDLLVRMLTGTCVVIPRRSVIVSYLEERGR
jgi:hypothetical protein